MTGKVLLAKESNTGESFEQTYVKVKRASQHKTDSMLVSVHFNERLNDGSFRVALYRQEELMVEEREYTKNGTEVHMVPFWENSQAIKRLGKQLFYATSEGLDIMRKIGYLWFVSDIYDPTMHKGTILGSGSESLVYSTNVFGNTLLIKIVDQEGIAELNKTLSMFHRTAHPPQYLWKFGKTEKIYQALLIINSFKPFQTFKLGKSPKDLVANEDFLIQEYLPLPSLDGKALKGTPWLKAFEDELKYPLALFAALDFWLTDFAPSNWLVSDSNASQPTLHLIDQAPAPISSARNEQFEDQYYEREEALKKFGKDPALGALKKFFNV